MKKYRVLSTLLFLYFSASAQVTPVKNLVFEGAGMRGIAYCGAIRALENKGMIAGIEKVGGTSAGAITALCVSLGYSSEEIATLLYATNFKKLNDGRFFFAGGVNRVNKYFGWYRGERLDKWLGKIITDKTGNADITFEEIHNKGFKDLYITATMLNEQKLVVLSALTYPHMRIRDAVRISVSIPFYFEAVFIDKEGKVIRRPKDKSGLDVMVDGGLVGNFPIRVFDNVENSTGRTSVIANEATLGFRIDRANQIENDKKGKELAAMPVTNLKEYTSAFYNMIMENLNRQTLSGDDWKRTISISDGDIAPRIRRLSKAEISTLIENGRVATEQFLRTK